MVRIKVIRIRMVRICMTRIRKDNNMGSVVIH